jgi:hypothetical protein
MGEPMDYPFTMVVEHKVSGWIRGQGTKTEARRALAEYLRTGHPGPAEVLIDEVGKASSVDVGDAISPDAST